MVASILHSKSRNECRPCQIRHHNVVGMDLQWRSTGYVLLGVRAAEWLLLRGALVHC
jgi:hypothetical protein